MGSEMCIRDSAGLVRWSWSICPCWSASAAGVEQAEMAVPELGMHDGNVDRAASSDRLATVRVDDTGSAVGNTPGRPSWPRRVRSGSRSRL